MRREIVSVSILLAVSIFILLFAVDHLFHHFYGRSGSTPFPIVSSLSRPRSGAYAEGHIRPEYDEAGRPIGYVLLQQITPGRPPSRYSLRSYTAAQADVLAELARSDAAAYVVGDYYRELDHRYIDVELIPGKKP